MAKKVWLAMLALLGLMGLGAGMGGNCMGDVSVSGGGSHMCCGGGDSGGGVIVYNPPPIYPPPLPGDTTQDGCVLLVSLIGADVDLNADLYREADYSDLLFRDVKSSIGEAVFRQGEAGVEPVFELWVDAADGSYPVYSDSEWAFTQQIDTDTWVVSFESEPDLETGDQDFNDAIITVEAVNCPGISLPLPPDSGTIVVPDSGASKVHVNFLRATFGAGDLYLDGQPPELLIDKASGEGRGAAARNFAAGDEVVFFLRTANGDLYSNDPAAAYVEFITEHNFRINYDVDGDGNFDDVIVHVVFTP